MNTVTVCASKTYDVIIGNDLLSNAATFIRHVKDPCNVAIISNTTVWPLYGETITNSLTNGGFQVVHYTIGDSESCKNHENYLNILSFLADNHITRSDLIIALGGGVVGDITGFSAATYLRGVDYIQIPTTLLAMVDSSVGGKTAIDLPQGKNLVGAFYQPLLVICDTDVLNTLPSNIFVDGCAEIIKYAMLYDAQLFDHLHDYGVAFDREHVISRCVTLKRDAVAEDEFDRGLRQMLNLGHTIGHAVEKNSNYQVPHGQAVAIGMAIITKAAVHEHFCDETVYEQLISVLNKFTLPCNVPATNDNRYSASNLFLSACSDKKRSGQTVNLIIPEQIGKCIIKKTQITHLQSIIESGL